MNRIVLLVALTIIATTTYSQQLDWKWSQFFAGNENERYDYGRELFLDSQDNLYLVGQYDKELMLGDTLLPSLHHSRRDFPFVAKFAPSGELQWANSQGLTNKFSEIYVDSAGNIHVFGITPSVNDPNLLDTFLVEDNGHVFYARYNNDWKLDLCHQIPSGLNPVPETLAADREQNGIVVVYNRDFIELQGDTLSVSFQDSFEEYCLIKFDKVGDVSWYKRFRITSYYRSFKIRVDQQNNIIVAGRFAGQMSFEDDTLTTTDEVGHGDIFVLKFTETGELLWSQHFGGTYTDYCNDVFIDQQNNIFLTGTIEAGTGSIGEFSFGSALSIYEPYLAKLNPDGEVQFAIFEPLNYNFAAGRSVVVNDEGTIFIAGQFNGSNAYIGDTIINTATMRNYDTKIFLAQYDPMGNFCQVITSSGTCVDRPTDLVSNSAGQLFLTGYFGCDITLGDDQFQQAGQALTNPDIFLSEINYEDAICTMVNDLPLNEKTGIDLKLYPNPTNNWITMEYQVPASRLSGNFIIRNQLGRVVKRGEFDPASNKHDIPLDNLPAGSYLLEVATSNGPILKKILVYR